MKLLHENNLNYSIIITKKSKADTGKNNKKYSVNVFDYTEGMCYNKQNIEHQGICAAGSGKVDR